MEKTTDQEFLNILQKRLDKLKSNNDMIPNISLEKINNSILELENMCILEQEEESYKNIHSDDMLVRMKEEVKILIESEKLEHITNKSRIIKINEWLDNDFVISYTIPYEYENAINYIKSQIGFNSREDVEKSLRYHTERIDKILKLERKTLGLCFSKNKTNERDFSNYYNIDLARQELDHIIEYQDIIEKQFTKIDEIESLSKDIVEMDFILQSLNQKYSYYEKKLSPNEFKLYIHDITDFSIDLKNMKRKIRGIISHINGFKTENVENAENIEQIQISKKITKISSLDDVKYLTKSQLKNKKDSLNRKSKKTELSSFEKQLLERTTLEMSLR